MLSKRIGTSPVVHTVTNYGMTTYKAVEFPNQYEYDEWLKSNAKFKPGDLLVYGSITPETMLADQWPVVTVVLRVEDDLPSLTYEHYGRYRGQPSIYEVRAVRSGQMGGHFDPNSKIEVRMDSCNHYRMLTPPEVDYVMSHDLISSRIKAVLSKIPGYPVV